jgi:hypothetical protein
MERVLRSVIPENDADTAWVIKRGDHSPPIAQRNGVRGESHAYGTIFEIGISRMSVAPASESAGMRILIPLFSTTDSTA